MRKLNKFVASLLAATLVAGSLAGCGSSEAEAPAADAAAETTETTEEATAETTEETTEEAAAASDGKVYYLNFKPEQAEDWVELASEYTALTGVPVEVVTAASNSYEDTLKSEMAKSEAPTLFQVNGPVGLATWKDYCYDLTGSEVLGQLSSEDFALKSDNGVAGIAYVVETYGIIYNKTILEDYFTKDYAVVKSVDEINTFDQLKAVADSIQANKDDLGVKGAFTSAGMDSSSDWRFKTHLANLPLYYEFTEEGYQGQPAEIKGSYLENYKNIWDLYITDATCDKAMLSAKTGDDATAEFAMGEAVFYQNGTWAWGDLENAGMTADDLGMLPIYIGAKGEENQGLCTGSENYWCVNSKASEADIKATLDFLNWCVTSEEGTTAMGEKMGFVIPFKAAKESTNPLIQCANEYIANGKTAVSWNFSAIPSETWKDNVGSALLEYAQGTGDWATVETNFVDGWKTEYDAAH